MIQLGYCIPISENNGSDTTYVNDDRDFNDASIIDDDPPFPQQPSQVPLHIGHGSTDWTIWDGGQIGGQPSWLHPEHLPATSLTCHCTNTKCHCYISQQQPKTDDDDVLCGEDIPIASKQVADDTTSQLPTLAKKAFTKYPNVLNFIGQFYAPPPPSSSSSSSSSSDANENDVFHRSIYIFGCTKCHLSQCYHRIRVLRTQLGKINRYWPSTISSSSLDHHPTDSDTIKSTVTAVAHLPITYYQHMCVICNFPARGKCPISQQFFCGNLHQRLYHHYSTTSTTTVEHNPPNTNSHPPGQPEKSTPFNHHTNHEPTDARQNQTSVSTPVSVMNGIYSIMELVVEEEPPMPSIVEIQEDNQAKLQATLFPNAKNHEKDDCGDNDDDNDDDDEDIQQNDLNDVIGKKNHPADAKRKQQNEENHNVFNQFTSRITERPNCRDQVLRYNCAWPQHNDSTDDGNNLTVDFNDQDDETNSNEPLWIRADHKPPRHIPKCPYCYSERQFEFQLMPQLLHYLNVNVTKLEKSTSRTAPAATAITNNNTNVVLDALRQTETILEQFHPTNIPPALLEHQQSIIEQRRQQLLLQDDVTDNDNAYAAVSSSRNHHRKDDIVNDLLRPPHDWGVVVVYTCPNSCSGVTVPIEQTGELNHWTMDNLGAYREEYVWVQPPIDVTT